MPHWWERWPGRLEYELSALEASGYTVHEQNFDSGPLTLRLSAPDERTGAGTVALKVVFPDLYPWATPQVEAPELDLPHHQHPLSRSLCLIGRATVYWDSSLTLADLLDTQLRKTITAGSAPADAGIDELDQGEPFSAYYPYADGMQFLLDREISALTAGARGQAAFLLAGPMPPRLFGERLVGLFEQISGDKVVLHQANPALVQMFAVRPIRLTGRWVVLDEPVKNGSAEAIWQEAAAVDPAVAPNADYNGKSVQLRAVGFPEERSRTERGIGWVVLIKEEGGPVPQKRKARSGNPARRALAGRAVATYHLAPVHRAGPADLFARTPHTADCQDKHVLVVGCGAIGSFLVDHLARAGVGAFTLIDKDVLEPGNLTRHAAALHNTGLHKAVAMARHVVSINPYAKVFPLPIPVGSPGRVEGQPQHDFLIERMREVDLVIDASAEVGIQEITADLARSAGVPLLSLAASEGAAGGTVVLIDPDAEWCFPCFQRHRIDGVIPFPTALQTKAVQPIGCAEPTFVGAGFDLAEVSLQAARVSVGRLLRDKVDAYPEDAHGAWVLTLRDPDGKRALPRWDGYSVTRHADCPAH